MEVLGVDLGFYQVKLSTKRGDKKFPSVVGYPSAIELENEYQSLSPEQNISIKTKEGTYYLGEKALRDTKNSQLTFTAEKTNNKTDRLKFFSALGLALEDRPEGSFHVVTGLPVDEFAGMNGLKDQLQRNMQQSFEYSFNGRHVQPKVPRVTVIPQSAGAYYDYILEEDGTVYTHRVNPKTLVIDIGYRTTDCVTMQNAKYSSTESFTILTGVSDIHREVKRQLLRHHQMNKDLTEIDDIVRDRYIYIGGRQVYLNEEIKLSTQPYAEKIASTIPTYFNNIRDLHEILVTGGGAELLIDEITRQFKGIPVQLMPKSEFSNARGYYKYAKFLELNGG